MANILLLPGDGIGPEIVAQAVKVLDAISGVLSLTYEYALIGGAGIDGAGSPFPNDTQEKALASDAVLLGAVGGPKWDHLPMPERAEMGILGIRKALGLYANMRPLDLWPQLESLSPLKPAYVKNVSLVVVRELTGDLYFGTPRGITGKKGEREGVNTMRYHESEIARIAHCAFSLAQKRRKKLCSVDKANVLETMSLWRQVVSEIHKDYPGVALEHMYVDNAAMQLIRRASDFDVLLTPNMFGDILSDEAAVLSGSLGLMPSASIGIKNALYEPIHGSAPDIAGKNIANPLGTILSVAMMLELSLGEPGLARKIRQAVSAALSDGFRTADIATPDSQKVGTEDMGDIVAARLKKEIEKC